MKNIYLVGFMGTGKTTVGKILAAKLDREFVEMDAVIESRQGSAITDIFANKGEIYFRRLESELLKELSVRENLVISCGGGLICNRGNLKLLKDSGIVVALSASVSITYERTKKYTCRPILNVENPRERIEELLKERAPYYAQAHHMIDTDNASAEKIADKIISFLNHG
jgi:shikimate kinase